MFAQAPQQLNISQDLVALGIAAQNANPNNSNLDTRPLLQSAIQYATANGISRITADQGTYWFLTPQKTDRYLVLNQLSDLTIDLQGSDIYFKNPFLVGFDLENCQRVTLANFTVDFVQLPFTQVQLTGVNNRTLSYQTIPGWPSPTTLSSKFGSTDYWGIVLRGGTAPVNTNRFALDVPKEPASLQIQNDHSPWTQPGVLSSYQPGDVIVVTLKDGDAPIYIENGDGIVLSGIDVYSSGTLGIHMDATRNSTVSRVRVMPRPGTDRLISTNADGIHLSYTLANNRIQSSFITRTMDDAIALSSEFLAFVDHPVDARSVVITRNFQTRVPNGTWVSFLNPNTGETFGTVRLASQNPSFESAASFNSSATYTFEQDLSPLQKGFGLVFAEPANRGQSTVVENNVIEDILFARGIFLGGVSGVTVQKNTIRRINCGGIVVHHELSAYPSAANQNIQISSNTVDAAIGPAAVGTGTIAALGSIFVLSTDASFIPLPNPTAINITITNNFISNAGRSAIWGGNMSGGTIQGNTISGYNLYPQLALYGVTPGFGTQLVQDFAQSIVLHASQNVSVQK